MGRPRIYYDYELPHGVVETVRGVVMDYDRREQAIKRSSITGSVLERYIELNDAVDAALGEVDGREIGEEIVADIFSRFCVGK